MLAELVRDLDNYVKSIRSSVIHETITYELGGCFYSWPEPDGARIYFYGEPLIRNIRILEKLIQKGIYLYFEDITPYGTDLFSLPKLVASDFRDWLYKRTKDMAGTKKIFYLYLPPWQFSVGIKTSPQSLEKEEAAVKRIFGAESLRREKIDDWEMPYL